MLTILIISFLVLLFVGVPVAFSMGLGAALAVVIQGNVPWIVIPQRIFVAVDSFPMLAIPLFILAGELMNGGGITRRIVDLASCIVGHIRGGLAHVNILASMIFAGISGSASADCSALGSMLIPIMKRKGYEPAFAVAVTASAATIGPIIPPSILMIIYGSITGISIGSLFLGGFVPGVLVGIALMVAAYIMAVRKGYKAEAKATLKQTFTAFRKSFVALVMPGIIIGGILTGVFTATEAGVVAVVYGFIVGFVLKELKLKDLKKIFVDSAIVTSTTMFVIGAAQIIGWILARERFPQILGAALMGISDNPTVILLMVLLFLFILGFFIDATAALIILVPVLAPIAAKYGLDPVHFAVLIVIMLLVGGRNASGRHPAFHQLRNREGFPFRRVPGDLAFRRRHARSHPALRFHSGFNHLHTQLRFSKSRVSPGDGRRESLLSRPCFRAFRLSV